MLYLVPTPIGNLEDITLRAIRTLKEVDLIIAEDTRTSKKLLVRYDIDTPIQSFHAHNEHSKVDLYIEQLKAGRSIALISDAGTPGISDPGYLIVRESISNEIDISCLPGPTAFVPALVMSGLPCDRFHFEGFLPVKKGRQSRLEYLVSLPNTFILYESPFRVIKTTQKLIDLGCGLRRGAVCRELTKIHEEVIRGELNKILPVLQSKTKIKGEIVMIIGPPKKS